MIAISFIASLAQPIAAFACTCAIPDPPEIVFSKSDAVFVGEVTQINDLVKLQPVVSTADPIQVVFQVSDSWKGITTTPIVLETALSSASCGYEFQKGNKYVVYALDKNGTWTTGLCTRTTDYINATADLNYLNTQPRLALTSASRSLPVMNYTLIAVVTTAAVAGAIGIAIYMSKRVERNTSK